MPNVETVHAPSLPYNVDAFKQLKELFPEVEYNTAGHVQTDHVETGRAPSLQQQTTQQTPPTTTPAETTETKNTPSIHYDITIEISTKSIYIKMPKNEIDIQFVRSFKYVRWDKAQFRWVIPNYGRNLDIIKSYFGKRNVEWVVVEMDHVETGRASSLQPTFTKTDFLVINNANRILKLYFSFNKELSQQLKQIPFCKWNGDKRCWEIPYSEKFMAEIKVIAQQNGLTFVYNEEKQLKIIPRTSKFDIENYRTCPDEYIAKLKELRYSENTLNTYKQMFEEFINHYTNIKISEITEPMIIDFLRYLVNERKISGSYQNQSINAIKFYYERVMGGQRKVYTIDRPRKENMLPEVLSEEEVISILNATENLKHKAMLMTIYSAGLRVSEFVNLKIKDIDSNRMQMVA